MRLVVFGLSVSSSWGNGHATLWRALVAALARLGHHVTFFERDVPYYAAHRDLRVLPGGELVLYTSWADVLPEASRRVADSDAAIITSYCPDGPDAAVLLRESLVARRVFYDLDTPITIERLRSGLPVPYLPADGLADFDLVLSYTGGEAIAALRDHLGAERVAPLYGSVDPEVHFPVAPQPRYRADLSYIGTYAADRQRAVEAFFLEPARLMRDHWFVLAGAQYPVDFPWAPNIAFVRHLPPAEHPAFYCSSALTLNVTRGAMAAMGYCPSGRLFEAAACGVPVLSDAWPGLDEFFTPGEELLVARDTGDALAALRLPSGALAEIGRAARERTLAEHTADHRARTLVRLLETPTLASVGSQSFSPSGAS